MLQISKVANISRQHLIRAIGIQSPLTRVWKELDTERSGCLQCNQRISDQDFCTECPLKVYIEKTEYINERNKYGDSSTLKSIPLRLYILLHFLHPNTQTGLIRNVSLNDLSDKLGCHKKSIISNLSLLYKYGYILFGRSEDENTYHIIISNYAEMFRKAREGGRGYLTLSDDLLEEILVVYRINDLRCLIRFVDDALINEVKGITKSPTATITYKNMRQRLPKYIKPGIIRSSIEKISSLFKTVVKMKDTVQVTLQEMYCGRKVKEKLSAQNESIINTYLTNLNNIVLSLSHSDKSELILQDQIQLFGLDKIKLKPDQLPVFSINKKDLKDLVQMSVEYTVDSVIEAINNVYLNHICSNNIRVRDNLGGLIRNYIRSTFMAVH